MIDDYLQYGQSTQKTFYQVLNKKEQIDAEINGILASFYFRFDAEYNIYERRIYSFGEMLGQIGGLFQIIIFLGVMIVSVFPERLFISSIIRKIYQIDQFKEKAIIDSTKSNKNKVNTDRNIIINNKNSNNIR